MPGLITHYIHGEAVLNELPKELGETLKQCREQFNIGTQGPDLFFYYLPSLFRKRIRGIGTTMHKGDFSKFLKGMLSGIKKAKNPDPLKSYLYGYLTHYALDTAAHPYIYYKTGSRKEGEIKSLKYSVYHRSFETAIDVLMIKLATGKKPSEHKLNKMIRLKKEKRKELSYLLAKNIFCAYNLPISSKQVSRAFSYMSKITWLLESKKGRRKRIMQFVEGLTVKDKIFTSLMHYGAVEEGIDYLNEKRGAWGLPWNDDQKSETTFVEMFTESATEAAKMIESCEAYFAGKTDLMTVLETIKNLSFSTGLHYEENVEFKYSDIVYAR